MAARPLVALRPSGHSPCFSPSRIAQSTASEHTMAAVELTCPAEPRRDQFGAPPLLVDGCSSPCAPVDARSSAALCRHRPSCFSLAASLASACFALASVARRAA